MLNVGQLQCIGVLPGEFGQRWGNDHIAAKMAS